MTPRNPSRADDGRAAEPQSPVRTCVGCRERAPRSDLVRLVVSGGDVVIDESHGMPGRGAYLHPTTECLDRARHRRAIGRALRQPDADLGTLLPEVGFIAYEPGAPGTWPPLVPNRRKNGNHPMSSR